MSLEVSRYCRPPNQRPVTLSGERGGAVPINIANRYTTRILVRSRRQSLLLLGDPDESIRLSHRPCRRQVEEPQLSYSPYRGGGMRYKFNYAEDQSYSVLHSTVTVPTVYPTPFQTRLPRKLLIFKREDHRGPLDFLARCKSIVRDSQTPRED